MTNTQSDTLITDKLCIDRNFTPYSEPASGKGTVASELAFLSRRFEKLLRQVFDDRGCSVVNHDGSRVVRPEWVERVTKTLRSYE